jgi:hypothetical protein
MWCTALVLLVLAGQRWTVGGSGPANFPTIQAAIDAPQVQSGDTLLVYPGYYGDFTLTKDLRIVARAQQSFAVLDVRVEQIAEFTIAGMNARSLVVQDVTGRGRLDQCSIGIQYVSPWNAFLWSGSAEFIDCAELLVTRSFFHGSDSCYPNLSSDTNAVLVRRSTVAFVDCQVFGGDDDACGNHPTFLGGPAIEAHEQSDVTLAGTTVRGGSHSSVLPGYPALYLGASHARIRGSSFTSIAQGPGSSATSAIEGAGATATLSGVTVSPPALPPWVMVIAEPEPWIRVIGSDLPGSTKSIELYGPAAAQVAIGLSATPLLVPTPLGPLWIDRDSLLRFYRTLALGQATPSTQPLPLKVLEGAPGDAFDLQGLAVQPSLSNVLTNPAQVILRW